jgi:hypothetical protein
MFPSQLDSANYFTDGEQIACLKWDRYSSNTGGLCILPQYLGKGKTIDGGAVTSAYDALIAHGCEGKWLFC